MRRRTVAIFTDEKDVTADYVVQELNRRGTPVFRCDPGDFPTSLQIDAQFDWGWTGTIRTASRTLNLTDISGAWWRRPSRIEVTGVAADTAEWATMEARAGFRGLMATLPWLNDPDRMAYAGHKALQLSVARYVGLRVPPTLITNDPDRVHAFAAAHGPLIYKPIWSGLLDTEHVIYASPVDLATVDDSVRSTMHEFQPAVPKDHELRITVVGDRIFAARIDATTDTGRRDWRADYRNLKYSTATVPVLVAQQLVAYLATLRLRFGAFDVIVTPDEQYMFLECNPNGQWAWIEDETGLPIAAAIADALEGRR
ncbi:ATP-grasp ribosomal peptide maturase [Hamadaea tsunoensis]|uniref:ATP-grasp ribosomal peptide maturase n=1 Tax=Hamadaea tsunoensis TaxID=53368 RepID=UPI000412304F|nr:ATP-grasp ribosomal peptide maturase [Hamadaea tsunoensis]